jgi:hypothetical protein
MPITTTINDVYRCLDTSEHHKTRIPAKVIIDGLRIRSITPDELHPDYYILLMGDQFISWRVHKYEICNVQKICNP